MDIVRDVELLRETVGAWREAGERIGFVPTMGNLHAGHLALVERASRICERVVVSIFVNPTQFGPDEDFDAYPRTREADLEALRGLNCDLVFVPDVGTVYPHGPEGAVRIRVPGIAEILEGEHRPGHFDGVCTVVARLFHMVRPDLAVFGEKDYQQLEAIRRMTSDLAMPVRVAGAPTVREEDGLALSSRNQYLTDAERRVAPALYRALAAAVGRLEAGERDFAGIERDGVRALEEQGFDPDYFSVRRPDLEAPAVQDREFVVLAAARLGRARLIDNLRAGSRTADGGAHGD